MIGRTPPTRRLLVGIASLGVLASSVAPSVAAAGVRTQAIDPITINTTAYDFGDGEVGTTSATVTFTITNNTDATAHYVSRTTSGTNDFTLFSDSCEGDLAAFATCDVGMQFNPSVEGPLTGSTSHEWDIGSATADLTGTGIVTPAPIVDQLTIHIVITDQVIDLVAGTMTLSLDAQPNRPVDYTYWATTTIGSTLFAGSTHTTVIDCATLPGMAYAAVYDPRRNPLNEATDMIWVGPCAPPPTDLATILIVNDTTVDFATDTRMVFVSNEVNGGLAPYTYTWDRSDGDGPAAGTRDQVFTFDCSLLPTTLVGEATDSNSDIVADTVTVEACGAAPITQPLTAAIEASTTYDAGTHVLTADVTSAVTGTTVNALSATAAAYTYLWQATIVGGAVTYRSERDYGDLVIDCNRFPDGASVELTVTSVGHGTVDATPMVIPCPSAVPVPADADGVTPSASPDSGGVVPPAPTVPALNVPLPATDTAPAEAPSRAPAGSVGPAVIVPIGILLVLVLGVGGLPRRRAATFRR